MAPPAELKTGAWYTIGDRRYLSVTAALDYVNAPALMIWSANLTAAYAVDNLPAMVAAMRVKPCGETKREKRCGACLPCLQAKAARQHWFKSEDAKRRGSAVHDVIEFWAQRGEWPAYDESVEPYIASLRRLLDEYGLSHESWMMTEATVFHEEDEWAGTLDGLLRLKPVTRPAAELCARMGRVDQHTDLLIDVKTREGEGARFYNTQPLQLAGYRHAAQVYLPGGRTVSMPKVHGGAVIQLRPDGATLRPVRCGPAEYETFCSVLGLARWMLSEWGGDRATQVQAFPVPDEWMWRRPEDATVRERHLAAVKDGGADPPARPRKRVSTTKSGRAAAGASLRGGGAGGGGGDGAGVAGDRPVNATLASLKRDMGMPADPGPAQGSLYGDEIPF